ncbi:MAG TPA: hypothetical protein VGJ22_02275 [Anaerolineales bacterium]
MQNEFVKTLLETTAKWLSAIVVLGLLFVSLALGAPHAESALECAVAADMALVARSLAEEEVQRPKAGAIMSRIYDVEESERGNELMLQILDAAYITKDASSQNFAQELFAICMANEGDMDTVLGRSA